MLTLDKHFTAAKTNLDAYTLETLDFRLDDFHIIPMKNSNYFREPHSKYGYTAFQCPYLHFSAAVIINGLKIDDSIINKPVSKAVHFICYFYRNSHFHNKQHTHCPFCKRQIPLWNTEICVFCHKTIKKDDQNEYQNE